MIKKLFVLVAVLIAVAAIAFFMAYSNLDSIVKNTIEKYGTRAAKAEVTVDTVKLSLTSGDAYLSGFKVGALDGFRSTRTIDLGSMQVRVDINSIRGTGPIIINEITVEKPEITYEVLKSGQNNMQALASNAQSYAGSSSEKAVVKEKEKETAGKTAGEDRKIIIKQLTIRDGKVNINPEMLQTSISAKLPLIDLRDIGGRNGATPEQIAQQLVSVIARQTTQTAAQALANQFASQINLNDPDSIKAAGKNIGNTLKGMFGGH